MMNLNRSFVSATNQMSGSYVKKRLRTVTYSSVIWLGTTKKSPTKGHREKGVYIGIGGASVACTTGLDASRRSLRRRASRVMGVRMYLIGRCH